MKFLGLLIFLVGLVSLLVASFGANHFLLLWVDNWGRSIGWAIRVAITIFGYVLYYLHRNDD
ncbi:hypothetical protein [Rufibacter tibetensis]|uniref:Uncharacterized protein n=1 Tax=Rufibacter tibetensis TaxID=512763 RepID=A0A0P0C824_9BACT|nr:hypothetical protein [Rufibacter tibetensis]ALJ01442.1 hypothetical protein DC20_13380 [Rufibacter tibetensis]